MLVTSELGRWSQEDQDIKDSLGYNIRFEGSLGYNTMSGRKVN